MYIFASVATLDSPLRPGLCRLMRGAARSILMTMAYFVPDDGLIEELGSTNLAYRSIERNCEISAVIRSSEFGRQMHELFESDVRFARPIELREWRRRPRRDRLVQWAVSRARYLM